ncbi:MAG TPA: hypothetical protein VF400_07890 [Anaeromyxobacteraceae bacterium]
MTRVRLLALAALTAALGCASPRPLAPTLSPAGGEGGKVTATATGGAWAGVARGMEAAEVRRRLGAPQRVEQVPSAAVHGSRYERWSYGAREVVLVDGKVIDVAP